MSARSGVCGWPYAHVERRRTNPRVTVALGATRARARHGHIYGVHKELTGESNPLEMSVSSPSGRWRQGSPRTARLGAVYSRPASNLGSTSRTHGHVTPAPRHPSCQCPNRRCPGQAQLSVSEPPMPRTGPAVSVRTVDAQDRPSCQCPIRRCPGQAQLSVPEPLMPRTGPAVSVRTVDARDRPSCQYLNRRCPGQAQLSVSE
eukprot:229103-Pyramimonas_sp.AAC.2